ncbi:unnamed protein product, partial [Symbiodinium pilosum]
HYPHPLRFGNGGRRRAHAKGSPACDLAAPCSAPRHLRYHVSGAASSCCGVSSAAALSHALGAAAPA